MRNRSAKLTEKTVPVQNAPAMPNVNASRGAHQCIVVIQSMTAGCVHSRGQRYVTLSAKSERVPVGWGRLFALAVYAFARAGELAALKWSDVDSEHGTTHVHRSEARVRKKGIKATKSETARRIPIEPERLPLLAVITKSTATSR